MLVHLHYSRVSPTATVLHAELTWTSLLIAGTVDYSAFANDPVDFTTPAGFTTVAVQFSDLTNNIATRSADVTALVQAGGSGQYTVGRIAGVNGIERPASLVTLQVGIFRLLFMTPPKQVLLLIPAELLATITTSLVIHQLHSLLLAGILKLQPLTSLSE